MQSPQYYGFLEAALRAGISKEAGDYSGYPELVGPYGMMQHPREVAELLSRLAPMAPKSLVEIGTGLGGFARLLIEQLPLRDVWVIDPLKTRRDLTVLQENQRVSGSLLRERGGEFHFLSCGSQAPEATESVTAVDVVVVDGNHSYRAVVLDLLCWWSKLRSGGVMIIHDWTLTSVYRAIHDVFSRTATQNYQILADGQLGCGYWVASIIKSNGSENVNRSLRNP